MFRRLRVIIMLIIFSVFMMYNAADAGEEVSRERIMGLDEQVQQIKSDVLSIAAELSTLEEKLLFPSNTQVAVFVSLIGGETFRLDALEIELGGEPVAHHLYTFKEFEALQKGGVQRVYTGNMPTGSHDMQVSFIGKSHSGADIRKTERFKVNKDVGPRIVEVSLAPHGITLKDR
jgi:hypothetical protein